MQTIRDFWKTLQDPGLVKFVVTDMWDSYRQAIRPHLSCAYLNVRLLREAFLISSIEYNDPSAKKKPFMSHEFYSKRILYVAPRHGEFEIHNSEFKTLVKNGVEHHVAVANCSLRIETWKFSALGTNVVKFLNNDPDTPVDLGSSLKSAVSNAFVGCCKSFFMSVEQLLAVKGEKVPGDTLRESGGHGRSAHSQIGDELVGDVCVKCGTPRRQSDLQACLEVNAGRVAYCKNCIPEHMVRKMRGK